VFGTVSQIYIYIYIYFFFRKSGSHLQKQGAKTVKYICPQIYIYFFFFRKSGSHLQTQGAKKVTYICPQIYIYIRKSGSHFQTQGARKVTYIYLQLRSGPETRLMLWACQLINNARKDKIQYFYVENINNNNIIIIFINFNWVVTRWQWLFYT
jgi:hypothetical protein